MVLCSNQRKAQVPSKAHKTLEGPFISELLSLLPTWLPGHQWTPWGPMPTAAPTRLFPLLETHSLGFLQGLLPRLLQAFPSISFLNQRTPSIPRSPSPGAMPCGSYHLQITKYIISK